MQRARGKKGRWEYSGSHMQQDRGEKRYGSVVLEMEMANGRPSRKCEGNK
jgi:hypothetical protein